MSSRRVVITILIAAAIISGALIIRQTATTPTNQSASADDISVTAAPERQAIPEIDSDSNGIPDWQEALVSTDTLTISAEDNNDYTPPDTVTGQFSRDFFEQVIRDSLDPEAQFDASRLANAGAEQIFSAVQDDPITREDITVSSDNSTAALKRYGNQVAAVLIEYSDETDENEIKVVQQALEANDPELLDALDPKIQAYADYLTYTMKIAAPSSLADAHVALLNSYQTLQNSLVGLKASFSDPALALIRLERYQEDTVLLLRGINGIYVPMLQRGVTWGPNEPASAIINQ